MDIQQLAPWASLAASLLTFAYVGVREWRRTPRRDESTRDQTRLSVAEVVSRADVFLFVAVTMLFLAGLTHYVLVLTSTTVLVVPVWMLALFVVVTTGLIQSMPGETFEEKVERFTDRIGPDVDIDVTSPDRNQEETTMAADGEQEGDADEWQETAATDSSS